MHAAPPKEQIYSQTIGEEGGWWPEVDSGTSALSKPILFGWAQAAMVLGEIWTGRQSTKSFLFFTQFQLQCWGSRHTTVPNPVRAANEDTPHPTPLGKAVSSPALTVRSVLSTAKHHMPCSSIKYPNSLKVHLYFPSVAVLELACATHLLSTGRNGAAEIEARMRWTRERIERIPPRTLLFCKGQWTLVCPSFAGRICLFSRQPFLRLYVSNSDGNDPLD